MAVTKDLETTRSTMTKRDNRQPVSTIGTKSPRQSGDPSFNEIQVLAYLNWEKDGCPQGDGIQYWLEAEKELQY